jgi:ABC-2 type transport system permease protein
MFLSAFRGEIHKIFRRRAVWVNIILLLVLAIGMGYVLVAILAAFPPPTPSGGQALDFKALKDGLYPLNFVKTTVGGTWASLGSIFALVLGVLVQGSEYGWGTVKTMYTQQPGRLVMLAGKLGALAVVVLVMVLALFAGDALASVVVATTDGKPIVFPTAIDIIGGIGASFLIYGFSAGFGFALATLFKDSAMAIGLGLAYSQVVEFLFFGLLWNVGFVNTIRVWFPFQNTGFLARAFGTGSSVLGGGATGKPLADGTHAVVVLIIYLIALVCVAAVVVRQRDVT